MTEPDADPIDPADGVALSEWLAGELAPAEAEALEGRLAAEPALARRLEALHDALVEMRGLDTAEPPEGFEARLAERLESDPGAEVVPLDRASRGARPMSGARPPAWGRLGAVAAALVLLAGAVSVPLLFGGGGGQDAATGLRQETAAEAESEAASEMETSVANAEVAPPRPTAPVIVEEQVAQALQATPAPTPAPAPSPEGQGDSVPSSEAAQALGDRFLTVPEAVGLLGAGLEEARGIAQAFTAAVLDAPAFSSGVRPGACLSVVTEPAPEKPLTVLVPARVESFTQQGVPALAYVLVGASTDAVALDRVELWVTDPVTCDTRIFLSR